MDGFRKGKLIGRWFDTLSPAGIQTAHESISPTSSRIYSNPLPQTPSSPATPTPANTIDGKAEVDSRRSWELLRVCHVQVYSTVTQISPQLLLPGTAMLPAWLELLSCKSSSLSSSSSPIIMFIVVVVTYIANFPTSHWAQCSWTKQREKKKTIITVCKLQKQRREELPEALTEETDSFMIWTIACI